MYPADDALLPAGLGALSLVVASPLFLDLLALPRPLALAIFALVPADTRLRGVPRLANTASRQKLVDSLKSVQAGGAVARRGDKTLAWHPQRSHAQRLRSSLTFFSASLLRAAVAKAGGQLRALNVDGRNTDALPFDVLQAAVAANGTTLVDLRISHLQNDLSFQQVESMLAAAPKLSLMLADVRCSFTKAEWVLQRVQPYGPLRLFGLFLDGQEADDENVAAFRANVAQLQHTSLKQFSLNAGPLSTAAATASLVDALKNSSVYVYGSPGVVCLYSTGGG